MDCITACPGLCHTEACEWQRGADILRSAPPLPPHMPALESAALSRRLWPAQGLHWDGPHCCTEPAGRVDGARR